MPHKENFTSASAISATFHSVDSVSQVRVSGDFEGDLIIEESIPAENDWESIAKISGARGFVISTPDPAMDLRVRPNIKSGTAKFYFGP